MSAAMVLGGNHPEVILGNGTSHAIPQEVLDQAEPGEEFENAVRWAAKAGLIPRESMHEMLATA